MKKLGASEKEIEEVCSTIYDRVTNDHMRRVLHNLRSSNPGKESLFEGLQDGKIDGWDKNRFEKFIKDSGLKKSEQTEEWIETWTTFSRIGS